MTTVTIRKHLDSDTLQIPELKPLLGKDVEITVRERPPSMAVALQELLDAAGNPPVDLDALAQLREDSKI